MSYYVKEKAAGKPSSERKSLAHTPAQSRAPVIQLCGGVASERRSRVEEFFFNMKKDQKRQKNLYVYSFVYSDGLGDAGQLKLLYDKVNSVKAGLMLQNVEMLCAYSLTDQIAQWRRNQDHKEVVPEDVPEPVPEDVPEPVPEPVKTSMQEDRESKIKNVCGVKDQNIRYAGDTAADADGKLNIRKKIFEQIPIPDWEVEYPVPDPDFSFPEDKKDHLLKIKEMGATNLALANFKAGDTLNDGLGYGVPDEVAKLAKDNPMSAETFLSDRTGRSYFVKSLLDKAWIVSVKNYKGTLPSSDRYNSFPEDRMQMIVKDAENCGAKLVIFAGMPKHGGATHYRFGFWENKHVICDDIHHDTLRDLMAKVTNGVIISGGEGLFAESLAAPDKKTVSVMAARYGFQYQEIAYRLLEGKENYSLTVGSDPDEDYVIKQYRIFFIDGQFYYVIGDKNFVEILENPTGRTTAYEELVGKKIIFSKKLSALWLPLKINCNLPIEKPAVIGGVADALDVFREQKQRLVGDSWFRLLDSAVARQE